MVFDTILRGGTVIDGSGKAGFRADVGMLDGKIAAVGNLTDARARRILDVTGRLVTPGFIDIHRHADAAIFRPGFGDAELCQGLTTIINAIAVCLLRRAAGHIRRGFLTISRP